jgi:hypothetical protein
MSELQAYLSDRAIPELFNRLYGDAERLSGDIERLQRFVELTMAERQVAAAADLKPAAPEPSAAMPVELESSARQRLEQEAAEAAEKMVTGFDLMTQQGQSTATSLAYALRIVSRELKGFNCPRMMAETLLALDGMGAAAREATSHG